MEFSYFELQGESLALFLEEERAEQKQNEQLHKALMEDRDDIESYRMGNDGEVFSLKFREGTQPPGMVRASRKLSAKEVRPSKRGKEAKAFRDFLHGIQVTADCLSVIKKKLSLPSMVLGSRAGQMYFYGCRVGHVGPKVIVEVPNEDGKWESDSDDLVPLKSWEFHKALEDFKDFDYKGVFRLIARTA